MNRDPLNDGLRTNPAVAGNPRLLACLGALSVVAIQLAYQARYQFGPIDDAYIHLRVAHNLAVGAGPVFNVGERVEVTSSPMWTLLLGALLWAGMAGKTATAVLGLAAAAGAGAATAVLGYFTGGVAAAIGAPIMLAVLPSFSAWTGSGMETPLAIAALAAAAASAIAKPSRGALFRTSVASGLLVYIRPELLSVVPSILVIALARTPSPKRLRACALAVTTSVTLVALLFLARYSYFHEWFPNTYYAKVANGGLTQRLRGLAYTSKLFTQHPIYCLAALWAATRKRGLVLWLGLVALNLLAATVWAGGDGFRYARLTLPALPFICAMAASLIERLPRTLIRSVVVGSVCTLQILWFFRFKSEWDAYFIEPSFARNAVTIAGMMSQMPGGTVATVGIGAIAYVSQRRILDLVGLADKHIARAKRIPDASIGHDHVDVDYVLARAPELVLPMPWIRDEPFTDDSEIECLLYDYGSWASALELVRDPRFRVRYVPRDYLQGQRHLRMWLRKDIAL